MRMNSVSKLIIALVTALPEQFAAIENGILQFDFRAALAALTAGMQKKT